MADTPAPGATTLVSAGGNLQTALNNASCGDTLQLQAGAVFSGNFTFPSKPCDDAHWIVIRTSALNSQLPPEGTRLLPCYAGVASLPGRPPFTCPNGVQNYTAKIISPGGGAAPVAFASGANHYRLLGLEITRTPSTGITYQLIFAQGTADKIYLDRSWVHGSPQDETASGFSTSRMTNWAVIDSTFTDFICISVVGTCTDSHAISGGVSNTQDGPGRITNNFIEASGENIIFGGGSATETPADMYIAGNHLFKPLTWFSGQPGFVGGPGGQPFMVKNLFELKNAQRVLFEGNLLEDSWGGFSQNGYAILLTPKNQAGSNGTNLCPICEVTDVTIRYNATSHTGAGISLANVLSDNGGVATAGERYSIHDIVLDDISASKYKGNGNSLEVFSTWPTASLDTVLIDHITIIGDPTSGFMSLGGFQPPMYGFTFTNSIIGQNNVSNLVNRRGNRKLCLLRCTTRKFECMFPGWLFFYPRRIHFRKSKQFSTSEMANWKLFSGQYKHSRFHQL